MLPTHNKWRSLSFGHIFRSNCLFNGTEREYHYFVSLTLTQEVSSWLMICGESKLFRSWIKIQHLAEGCLWLRSILGTLSRLFVYSELWRICIILYFCLLACMHWSRSLTWFALNSPAYKYTGDNEHDLEHIVLSNWFWIWSSSCCLQLVSLPLYVTRSPFLHFKRHWLVAGHVPLKTVIGFCVCKINWTVT